MCVIIRVNVAYEGFRVLDYLYIANTVIQENTKVKRRKHSNTPVSFLRKDTGLFECFGSFYIRVLLT